jgi:hypothetical protein
MSDIIQFKRPNSLVVPADATLPGGWRVPDDPWDMLLTVAEKNAGSLGLGTVVNVYEEMAKYVREKDVS